jgi:hypothetical protein
VLIVCEDARSARHSLRAGIESDNEAKAASVSGERAAQRTVWWVAGVCRGMNDAEDGDQRVPKAAEDRKGAAWKANRNTKSKREGLR